MYFFALSQAPPVLAAEVASITPETIAPGKKPASILGPKANPITKGESMT
jgi:hypothetical protein